VPVFLFDVLNRKTQVPSHSEALPGRDQVLETDVSHAINGHPLKGPYPAGFEQLQLGLGCFWGAERIFWELPGVWVTAVGYAGGVTKNATYHEVCTGMTGHTEIVLVVYDPQVISTEAVLKAFWENHDPTQGMRQGNDVGTQYRSAIFTANDDQMAAALATRDAFQAALSENGHGRITTEIAPGEAFYFAEGYHQQYLHKRPDGYCGLGGTGVACPTGLT